jgi:hypothetical protein
MDKPVLDTSKFNNSFEDYNRLLEECIINKKELDSTIVDMIGSNIGLDKLKFNVKFI